MFVQVIPHPAFTRAISRADALTGTATPTGEFATIDISALDIQPDDVIVLAVGHGRTANQDLSASGNNSGAYSEEADLFVNAANDVNLGVFVQKQGASADTSITVAGLASPDIAYNVLVYRGVDTIAQIDVATATATGANTDIAKAPAITPATAGARIIAIYCGGQSESTPYTAPGNMSNFVQEATATTVNRVASADFDWSWGPFDPEPVGGGQGAVSGLTWAAATIALRP